MPDETHSPHVIPEDQEDPASLDSLDPVHAVQEVVHADPEDEPGAGGDQPDG